MLKVKKSIRRSYVSPATSLLVFSPALYSILLFSMTTAFTIPLSRAEPGLGARVVLEDEQASLSSSFFFPDNTIPSQWNHSHQFLKALCVLRTIGRLYTLYHEPKCRETYIKVYRFPGLLTENHQRDVNESAVFHGLSLK